MATKQTTLLPILAVLALVIVGTILYQQFSSGGAVKSGPAMEKVPAAPAALPNAKGADGDNARETLQTVVTSNAELRKQITEIIERNKRLEEDAKRIAANGSSAIPAVTATTPVVAVPNTATNPSASSSKPPSKLDELGNAVDTAGKAAESLFSTIGGSQPQVGKNISTSGLPGGSQAGSGSDVQELPGVVSYKTIPAPKVSGSVARNLVASRTALPGMPGGDAQRGSADMTIPADIPYFTVPENATLVGVRSMTSIVGRVPVDGKVTDPMQFKLIVGRDNLAANGWDLPDDLAGMIFSGVAIGDMALSCSEGKLRSVTFVFNDGTIRTVSSRKNGAGGASGDLGYISDDHGNPCITGKFVTNAPAYLTDIVGAKTLGVAAHAFAEAAKLVTERADGTRTTQITDTNKYVMGSAAAGASDELTSWLMQRLKSSFDAVVTPSGREIVVHLDQELRLDKAANARKITHRTQAAQQSTRGVMYGLE